MPDESLFAIDVTLRPPVKVRGELLIGKVMGGFRLTRLLGSGGMGCVYLGEHTVIGSRVAVKVLHRELGSDPEQVARFRSEARAVNLIDHENIVRIFDLSQDDEGRHYFVMELLEGRTLTTLLGAPMPPDQALPLLDQVLAALGAAHRRGIVHRDLKPDNIFLVRRATNSRFVKVVDFGVAMHPGAPETAAQMPMGTPSYMSPEQWAGRAIDGRSDLYAVGVIAYRLATGRLPFPRGTLLETMACHRDRIPAAPHEVNPDVPRAWSDAILRALAKRPEHRFQSAALMAAAFARVFSEQLPSDSASVSAPAPLTPAIVNALPATLARATPVPISRGTPVPVVRSHAGTEMTSITPVPVNDAASRHSTRYPVLLRAQVLDRDGLPLFHADCTELSRGGLFVCFSGAPPALSTRLRVVISIEGQRVDCPGEVVRHVSEQDSARWHKPAGFAVQFVSSPQSITQAIATVASSHPGAALAARLEKLSPIDCYGILGAAPDATAEQLRNRVDELRFQLIEADRDTPLPHVQKLIADAVDKLRGAAGVLLDPLRRAEYDLRQGNFRGIARCLESGLEPDALEAIHHRFAAQNAAALAAAQEHFQSGCAYRRQGELDGAELEFESALRVDPAHPGAHAALRELLRATG